MELLLTITALRRAGANSITAVIPYFGYKFIETGGCQLALHYRADSSGMLLWMSRRCSKSAALIK